MKTHQVLGGLGLLGFLILGILLFPHSARAAGPYYSKATATSFSTSDWGDNPDGSGNNPIAIDNASDFVIANGAMITISSASVTVRNLTVNSGASLSITGTNTLTANGTGGGSISVSGYLTVTGGITNQIVCVALAINSGGAVLNSTTIATGQAINVSGLFSIADGGTYIHNTKRSANIGGLRSFASASNFEYREIVGFSATPTYGNLIFNSGGAVTLGNYTLNIAGDLIIQNGVTYRMLNTSNAGASTINLTGNLILNGTGSFTGNISSTQLATLNLGGSLNGGAFYAGGAANGFVLNFTGGTTNVVFAPSNIFTTTNNVSVANVPPGKTVTLGNTVMIDTGDSLTLMDGANIALNSGDVSGAVVRSGTFLAGTSYAFNHSDSWVNFSDVTLGVSPTITMTLTKRKPDGLTNAVTRGYTITASGIAPFTATVKLHYEESELAAGGVATDTHLSLFKRESGGRWVLQSSTVDPVNNFVVVNNVSSFSEWALTDNGNGSPSAITLSNFHARTDFGDWFKWGWECLWRGDCKRVMR